MARLTFSKCAEIVSVLDSAPDRDWGAYNALIPCVCIRLKSRWGLSFGSYLDHHVNGF